MNTKTLTVVARLTAKRGQETQVRRELLSLLAPSRQDAGCVNYDLHQATEDPARFLFHENWTDKAHLDAHLGTPHVQGVLGKIASLLAEPPQVTLWEKLG